MAAATFFVLVKSGGQAAPAADAAAQQNIVESFEAEVKNAAARTGVTPASTWVAGGTYDYILEIEIDTANWQGPPAQGGGPPSPQQIAIGFSAALAQAASVSTETVPVFPLEDDIKAVVGHSCG